ncbi:MAG: hypothetical protein EXR99_04210 [Gemmataceae bacterium]|nr:hypothetical protein [Gemmataceae bacterium]
MAFYIDVPEIESFCEKIRQAGGEMVVEKMEVPGVGCFSLFKDPDGRVIGMWQQNKTCPGDAPK